MACLPQASHRQASITYEDAVDEALCFGWVDTSLNAWMMRVTPASSRRGSLIGRRPTALSYFESLAPYYRRLYIGWIDSAKQQETKMRRLQEAIGLLAAGKKLGLK